MVPPPGDDGVLRNVLPPLPTDDEREQMQMTEEQDMQIVMTEQDDMLEDMEDGDDDDGNGPPPNVFPVWLIAACAGLVVAVLTILGIVTVIDAKQHLSAEDAQAHALWIDYNHAVTTVGGGSAGNGGHNTGRSACPGSPEAVHAKCHLTLLFAEPCLRVLALVNGRIVGGSVGLGELAHSLLVLVEQGGSARESGEGARLALRRNTSYCSYCRAGPRAGALGIVHANTAQGLYMHTSTYKGTDYSAR